MMNTAIKKRFALLGLGAAMAFTAGTAVADVDVQMLDPSGGLLSVETFSGAGITNTGTDLDITLNTEFGTYSWDDVPVATITCDSAGIPLSLKLTSVDPSLEGRRAYFDGFIVDSSTGIVSVPDPEEFEWWFFDALYIDLYDFVEDEATDPVFEFTIEQLVEQFELWAGYGFNGDSIYIDQNLTFSGDHPEFPFQTVRSGLVLKFEGFSSSCLNTGGGLQSLFTDLSTTFDSATDLKPGTQKALTSTADAILSLACAYEDAEQDGCVVDAVVACNRLNSLQNKVLAQYGKQLSVDEADDALDLISAISSDDSLRCGL